MIYLLVGIAGALGASLRYTLSLLLFNGIVFPLATLSINLVGCFLLSYLTAGLFTKSSLSASIKTAIGTGFIGSFTTFSAFSVETITLFTNEKIALGILYIFISLLGGLLMTSLGLQLQKRRLTS
ncbi:fluoride efflux transporter CrcB [Bacillus sp. AGMB 02131]|uniref:Fluoride-specific ion channel FluC n=1 Tax=Peribacillus faecalis TaxID=2772559 RepID=A0A927CW53_9BACI|nr:fluoride efflux transporter CrcB [Peribacillus faecalis]MBD3108259.1 fluoride efflux transporter CrcB [Peribacillus faecalis]